MNLVDDIPKSLAILPIASKVSDQFLEKMGLVTLHILGKQVCIDLFFEDVLLGLVRHDAENRRNPHQITILVDQFLAKGIHGADIRCWNSGDLS